MKASVREHLTQHINEMMTRLEQGAGAFVRVFVAEGTR
jgi:hypothetical protein